MREGLAEVLDTIPDAGDQEADAKMIAASEAFETFVDRFP